MTTNQIAYWNLQEQKRSNRAVEQETARANIAREMENIRHNTTTESIQDYTSKQQAKRWSYQNVIDSSKEARATIAQLLNPWGIGLKDAVSGLSGIL